MMPKSMSVDPMADSFPEWSPYTYALNNPLRFVDPTGLSPRFGCYSFQSTLRNTFGWAESGWNRSMYQRGQTRDAVVQGLTNAAGIVSRASGLEGALAAPGEILMGSMQIRSGMAEIISGNSVQGLDQALAGLQRNLDATAEVSGFVENISGLATLTPAAKITAPVFAVSSKISNVLDIGSTVIEFNRLFTGGATNSSFSDRLGWTYINVRMPGRISRDLRDPEAAQALIRRGISVFEDENR